MPRKLNMTINKYGIVGVTKKGKAFVLTFEKGQMATLAKGGKKVKITPIKYSRRE